jgi:glycosyltransferase involved in cell wall biosynthesis
MGKGKAERVSIIMPFFRAGIFLREAIESVLAQDGDVPWRLYLINDGSDDPDVETAHEFFEMDKDRICLVDSAGSSNLGSSAARNLGVTRSEGDIIAFLDADDVWYRHTLCTQVNLLDSHPTAAMSYGSALRWYKWNGGVDFQVTSLVHGFEPNRLVPGAALLETFLRDEAMTPCTGSVMVRRSAFDACGGFEEQFKGLFDDQVLYAKICFGNEIYVTSQELSMYRKHDNSCCSRAVSGEREAAERRRFMDWLAAYRKERRSFVS